jgi:hypothetical protein
LRRYGVIIFDDRVIISDDKVIKFDDNKNQSIYLYQTLIYRWEYHIELRNNAGKGAGHSRCGSHSGIPCPERPGKQYIPLKWNKGCTAYGTRGQDRDKKPGERKVERSQPGRGS